MFLFEKKKKNNSISIFFFSMSSFKTPNETVKHIHFVDSSLDKPSSLNDSVIFYLLIQACKVPMWSKIGRLKRRVMPKLTRGSTIFGSGASPGIMSCIAGRLLCDTYLCSRDLLKEV